MATFTDTDPGAAAIYSATITWGDGTTSTVTSTASAAGQIIPVVGGVFEVDASHTYLARATVTLSVEIDGTGRTSVDASQSGIVVANPLVGGAFAPPVAVEGTPFTNVLLYHFSDSNPDIVAGDFTARITWGDGTNSTVTGTPSAAGQVVADAAGGFDVLGSYEYAVAISRAYFSVSIRDLLNDSCGASTYHLNVADAPLTAGALTPPGPVGNVSFSNVPLFTFSDGNALETGSDLTATIAWGDGTTSIATTSSSGDCLQIAAGGTWVVCGSHTYQQALSGATFSVQVNDAHGASTGASVNDFTVSDTAPAVTSLGPIGSAIAAGASSLQFALNFNENVTGLVPGDFVVAGNGATGTVTGVTGSGSSYVVTVGDVSGNGLLGLNLVDDDSIVDAFGTPLGGFGTGNGNFTGQAYALSSSLYWEPGSAAGGSGDWAGGAYWAVGAATGPLTTWINGADAILPAGTGTVTIAGQLAANSLACASLTIVAGTVDLDGNSILAGSLSGSGTITNSNASSPSTLTVNQATSTTYSGDLEDGAGLLGLNLSGGGSLTLGGTDSFSGNITVGGQLNITGALTGNGTLTVEPSGVLDNSGTLFINTRGSLYNSGCVENHGTLTNYGYLENTGSLTDYLSLYSGNGGTLDNNGTFTVAAGGTAFNGYGGLLEGNNGVVVDGTLWYETAYSDTYAGDISGSGELITVAWAPNAYLTLAGDNSGFTGEVFMYSGNLRMGSATALGGPGSWLYGGGTLDLNGYNLTITLQFEYGTITNLSSSGYTPTLTAYCPGGWLEQSFSVVGNLAFVVAGTGYDLSLGTLDASGGTTIDAGNTLWVGWGGYPATLGGNVVDNGTLILSGSLTVSGAISGTGSVQVGTQWSGTVVLTGNDTYSGGAELEGGTLVVGNQSALGTGGLTVNGGTLDLDGYSITVAALNGTGGTITNNGSNSPATLTVNDPNSDWMYFGGTLQDGQSTLGLATLGSGTLALGGTCSLGGNITVGGGSGLDLGGAFDANAALVVYGALGNYNTMTTMGTLTIDNGGHVYNFGTLNNTGTLTIDNGCWLNNWSTLNNNGTLMIDNGSALYNNSTMTNTGTLTTGNGCWLCNYGTMTTTGTLTIDNGGTLYISGTMTIAGTLTTDNGGALWDYGTLTVDPSGLVDNYGTLINAVELTNNGTVILESGCQWINVGTLDGDGTLTDYTGQEQVAVAGLGQPADMASNVGTLPVGNVGTTVGSSADAADQAILAYMQNAATTINNAISGSAGSVIENSGGGELTLTGLNDFYGSLGGGTQT